MNLAHVVVEKNINIVAEGNKTARVAYVSHPSLSKID